MGKLTGKKILVIEDDAQARYFMEQFLEEENCEYKTAEDGLSALAIFRDFKPHCVLLDIMLPKMNGVKVLKKIRELDSNALVIMTTGVGNIDIVQECLRAGAYTHIVKPLDFESLTKVVSQAMGVEEEGKGFTSSPLSEKKDLEDPAYSQLKYDAAVNLLLQKKILSHEELQAEIESLNKDK